MRSVTSGKEKGVKDWVRSRIVYYQGTLLRFTSLGKIITNIVKAYSV